MLGVEAGAAMQVTKCDYEYLGLPADFLKIEKPPEAPTLFWVSSLTYLARESSSFSSIKMR